jgi:hypothetical protein
MNDRESEKGFPSIENTDQPYQVRLPRFILDEEIGLGDAIKKVTYAFGIRPSSDCGCGRRAAMLNRLVTLSPKH